MSESAVRPVSESEVDWESARAFLRRRLRDQLRGTDASTIEDLTQEALVRLLRALRREGARHLAGLMSEIARRTATDHIRSKVRWRHVRERLEQESGWDGSPQALHELGDPLANLRFVVLEFFRSGAAPCADLARLYFEEQTWQLVALRRGTSHAAIRKQWSRCLEQLRTAAARDPELLWRTLGPSGEDLERIDLGRGGGDG